jgi:hypothetical protein
MDYAFYVNDWSENRCKLVNISDLPLKVWLRESVSRADLAILAFDLVIRNKPSLCLKPSHCLVRDRDPVRQTLPFLVNLWLGL